MIRPGYTLSYADHVGLELNLPRVRLQMAAVITQGLSAAFSKESLDRSWADAVSDVADDKVISEILYQANAERADARNKEKLGWEALDI